MARIALKVDVDTWRGTREGVPALVRLLSARRCGASFLFSLGPDHTGRAVLRVLRPGFIGKVARTSVVEHYGVRTLLHGVLLPGPDIGRREAATLRGVRDAGFEVGVHCWDHVRWQDGLLSKDGAWAEREMRRALDRHAELFGAPARVHGAAGWQFNAAAARAEAELRIEFASDTRGTHPFVPVADDGTILGPPQYPTTLPTLDELIGLDGLDAGNVDRHLLGLTEQIAQDQVYTLHAELEGQKLRPVLERLIAGWQAQGHSLVALGNLHEGTAHTVLPRHRIALGSVPGRSGLLAVQGKAWQPLAR
ncbi:putative 4-deoxy-4-formamido-L-arabinose-phosphoundecaprenol deformylase ArnD [Variovorax sp. PBS-H4]|uniref:4-deoxy-4-formamido-L-arabinose- phosphoundecaprenol deformylase n=1 Tax=Variovorax sp. PBS-H4 TaxID=434008 RepID=UPI001316FF50|nr:4-deoxy-4-formamido-L-arabinose-phosphoundecaprenol deformylase [Variovorax sp. PBS-H4]VTU30630.1 putative 4-deoxy-4-formamido-L-arabinose-phosphoundecaprenol deformylase ArnD [Variovorax sp. PBS-H4]